jgi:hypothetical protein
MALKSSKKCLPAAVSKNLLKLLYDSKLAGVTIDIVIIGN